MIRQRGYFEFYNALEFVFGGVARTKATQEALFREFLQDRLQFRRTDEQSFPDDTDERVEKARRSGFSWREVADMDSLVYRKSFWFEERIWKKRWTGECSYSSEQKIQNFFLTRFSAF